ncbi:DNA-processing protein DprA [Paenibacillus marinisediminis]
MPTYLNKNSQQAAECYFTLLALNKSSPKQTAITYKQIPSFENWESCLENFGYESKLISDAKKKVTQGIEKLSEYVIVACKDDPIYPKRLLKVEDSPEILFLRGELSLLDSIVISVVGSRKASEEGQNRARRLARLLSERGIIVASGLATGIDKSAHQGTHDAKKPTIAVIGTPINKVYPKEHEVLQNYISETGLVVSQFAPSFPVQRWNFPMRNATMSGISIATIVIEASETSGALIQAREALKQKREVFIPYSAVENPNLKWPKRFINELGANMFTTIEDLVGQLQTKGLLSAVDEQPMGKGTAQIWGPENVT